MKYQLYTDGSHSSSLSIAGIGGYLLDDKGQEVWRFSESLRENMAYHELYALKYALQKCLDTGVTDVVCHSDHYMNMRELSRREKHTGDTIHAQIFNQAFELTTQFKSIDFKHIDREYNKLADSLSRVTLKGAMRQNSRVKIAQKNYPDKPFFTTPKLLCTEQFMNKNEYFALRNTSAHYYVFDIQDSKNKTCVNSYYAHKRQVNDIYEITHHQIGSTEFENKKWIEFLKHVQSKLENVQHKNITIILPAQEDISFLLRGLKPIPKKMKQALNEFAQTLEKFDTVFLESSGIVYDNIFPPAKKLPPIDKEAFVLNSLKILGDNYKIGQDTTIETFFDLPVAKRDNVQEIQKKYFGEFIRMMLAQTEGLIKPKISTQAIKENLQSQGVKFTY